MRHMFPGRFIVVEGTDGAGTTTHSKRLARTLRGRGLDVELTCEPTPGPIGALLRQVLEQRLLLPDGTSAKSFSWSTMALLFAADRLDHLDTLIVPALRDGRIVISDRYDLSGLIYQSVTAPRGADELPWIRAVNARALRPDLTVVLDVSDETAKQRRGLRGAADELFDDSETQARLAAVYRRASVLLPEDAVVEVSAEGAVEAVAERVLAAVDAGLRSPRGPQEA